MNNELRDPLEKVSNSLRRAVSINKSKETDLRTAMNTIQRERRRSFNTWSLKQEKFLRAKQNLVPAMLFDQGSQKKSTKTDDSKRNKPRERRITLVRAVAPVSLDADRSWSPDIKLPSITTNKTDERRKKKSTAGMLPPVITLANSSQFFQENKRTRRISDHRQPFAKFASDGKEREHDFSSRKVRKSSNIAAFASDKMPLKQSKRTAMEATEEETFQQAMPGIKEERDTTSQASDPPYTPVSADLPPDFSATENNGANQRAKGQWKKVRDSLGKITEKNKKTDINKLSMMELTKLYEEIRECRYLRVGGNHSSFTADGADHSSNRCKCLACAVKDKNKLKNHLSAPE